MMQKQFLIFLFFICGLAPSLSYAQVSFRFSDLFKQNDKERNNLLQQIIEIQLYLEALRKGYQLTQSGLQTIRDIKNGEFTVHDLYYLSKKQVSPAVRAYPSALQTITHAQFVQSNMRRFLKQINQDQLLSAEQKDFLRKTSSALLQDVERNTDELQLVLTNGKLQLSDPERIQWIQKTLLRSQEQVAFSKTFCNNARMVAASVRKEAAEAAMLRGYYELKK